jgi:hypothetical protein
VQRLAGSLCQRDHHRKPTRLPHTCSRHSRQHHLLLPQQRLPSRAEGSAALCRLWQRPQRGVAIPLRLNHPETKFLQCFLCTVSSSMQRGWHDICSSSNGLQPNDLLTGKQAFLIAVQLLCAAGARTGYMCSSCLCCQLIVSRIPGHCLANEDVLCQNANAGSATGSGRR